MLINNFLENSALKFPLKKAVWFNKKWMTFGAIEEKANTLANFLIEQGIKKGDRVALLSFNSFNYIISYYAILKAGGVTVELNTETTADDVKYVMNDCAATALICQERFTGTIGHVIDELPSLQMVVVESGRKKDNPETKIPVYDIEQIYNDYDSNFSPPRVIDIDTASIVYTSGSTGKPKGVVLSHLNIVTNTRSIVEYLNLSAEDRIMVILPFFYVYGKSLLNTHFYVSGSVVIDNRFAFPNAILRTMYETECTGFSGVPSTFSILLNKSSIQKWEFPKLRYVTQAGGAMAPSIQKKVAKTFEPAKLFIMYGATEASARLSYLPPDMLGKKWGSIGKAIPNVELFIADQKGNPLPPGESGEIVARGANIMQGYWNDPEETARVLKNGLYFTGDLGVEDEDGYLYVVGRKKDMIKVGANRISPKSIEEKLLENPGIHEVAVIGVEDEVLGEAIKAYLVPNNSGVNISTEEVLRFCKKELPPFKVPKYIEFVDSLPKNSSGKVLKQKLRAKAAR